MIFHLSICSQILSLPFCCCVLFHMEWHLQGFLFPWFPCRFGQWGFPGSSDGKKFCDAGNLGSTPGLGRSPEEGMATHSSILARRIPWTEEHGGLQSMGLQRAGHDWVSNTLTSTWSIGVITKSLVSFSWLLCVWASGAITVSWDSLSLRVLLGFTFY